MIGFIYSCKCLINNKYYIGQTTRTCEIRGKEHKRHAFEKTCGLYECHFYRAIRKYGLDNFEGLIIESIEKDTLKELIKELDFLETYYINKFDSYKNGYNSTLGGDHSTIIPKSVKVYSETGVLLDTFESAREASEFYNISVGVIQSACGKFSYYTLGNENRIVFRGYEDEFTKDDIDNLRNIHYNCIVKMYDLSGNLINTFKNVSEAAKTFDLKNERISNVCNKRTSFVLINGKRYIFRYLDDAVTNEDLEKVKRIKSDPKSAVIAIDAITNDVIGKFPTQKAAGLAFNISNHRISEACSGKRETAGVLSNGHAIKWIKEPIL